MIWPGLRTLKVCRRLPAISLVATFAIFQLVARPAMAVVLSEGWSSVRALGMGNAYTATVENSDALFYNPAALGKVKGFNWTVFDPRAGVNGLDTVKRLQDVSSSGKNGSLADELGGFYGHPIFAEVGSKSAFTFPGFGFGAYANSNANITLDNPAYPNLNLDYFFDYGFTAGGAFDIVPEIMQIGLVARRFNRTGTTETLTGSQLATMDTGKLQDELKRRGTAYAVDMGFLFTAPTPAKPTLSFVWKDVGTTTFTHESGIGAPQPVPSNMTVGLGFELHAPLITIHPSLDYDYLNRSDLVPLSKLHLGVEVSLPLIDIRAGLNQGYYTAGAGLNLGLLHVDAATYGVELGQYPGQHEDRRYVAQVTFEFGFDPGRLGFGSSGGSGSGRLKQRR